MLTPDSEAPVLPPSQDSLCRKVGSHVLDVEAALGSLGSEGPPRDWQQQLHQALTKLLDSLESTRGVIRKALFFLLMKV